MNLFRLKKIDDNLFGDGLTVTCKKRRQTIVHDFNFFVQ